MKIVLATDHTGFDLKNHVKDYQTKKGYQIEDFAAYEFNTADDYADFIMLAAVIVVMW